MTRLDKITEFDAQAHPKNASKLPPGSSSQKRKKTANAAAK